MISLGKPLTSQLSMPAFLTTWFSAGVLNHQIWPCIQCHNEDITTDTIESNVPAIDGGLKYAQIFIGTMLLLTNIYPLKSISMFPSVLSDHIIDCGAPSYTPSQQ
jgi:hypothetical protein